MNTLEKYATAFLTLICIGIIALFVFLVWVEESGKRYEEENCLFTKTLFTADAVDFQPRSFSTHQSWIVYWCNGNNCFSETHYEQFVKGSQRYVDIKSCP